MIFQGRTGESILFSFVLCAKLTFYDEFYSGYLYKM